MTLQCVRVFSFVFYGNNMLFLGSVTEINTYG